MGGNAEHAAYAPCSLTDLDASGMDYWALGHIHKRQLLREGGPWVAYSGDTQGRSTKPSEMGPKGVLVVDVSGSTIDSVRFAPVDVVRFATCTVNVCDVADVSSLQSRVVALLDEQRRTNDEQSLLVRVVLEGRGSVASDLHREGAVAELCGELRAGYEGLNPFLWVESIKDRSQGALDLGAMRERDDFSAELLSLADGLAADSAATAAFIAAAEEMLAKPGQVERTLRNLEAEAPDEVMAEALELRSLTASREADR